MTDAPLAAGVTIAPGYEVISHLSRGRSLDVYDVWSIERGCRCVAKGARGARRDDAVSAARLRAEGRLLRELSHPHIVRGYETLEVPEPVVIMETLRGETLAHLAEDESRPLDVADIGQLGLQLGSAIRYLHRFGVLHMDLKPSNVIAEAGRAKLIDLSLARAPGRMEAGVGTWCYMAPEQARGGSIGPEADVWGLGAVLFEAATGRALFDDPERASDAESSSSKATTASYPQLWERAPRVDAFRDVPVSLADLVAHCLDPEPAQRPSVTALLSELERFDEAGERRWSVGGSDRIAETAAG